MYIRYWNCLWDANDKQESFHLRGPELRLGFKLLNEASLSNLGFRGPQFLWSNGQQGKKNVKERLDWAASNGLWILKFPKAYTENISVLGSDHLPIMLHLQLQRKPLRRWPFCF